MTIQFASRINRVQRSFIREILKATEEPQIISFAGGLPNPKLFPIQEIRSAAAKVLNENGQQTLQYSTTEGYLPLREYIAARYRQRMNLLIDPSDILITNGSQQGLDLIGKIFLDKGDRVLLERPAYLGAIQAFSMYEPEFDSVALDDDGINIPSLRKTLLSKSFKLCYTVPNFQNPSGISYSMQKREEVAALFAGQNTLLIEDDPYGELRFLGNNLPSIRKYNDRNIVLLGSFSKIVAPGLRLGWICAGPEIMEQLITVKQGSDLHSNYLAQRILYQYLCDNDLDSHIEKIRTAYGEQRNLMVQVLEEYAPKQVCFTKPEGGMFLWLTLPGNLSSLELFERALTEKVAFVPGNAFYVDGTGTNTLRLNFSNSDPGRIETGIKRLANTMTEMLNQD